MISHRISPGVHVSIPCIQLLIIRVTIALKLKLLLHLIPVLRLTTHLLVGSAAEFGVETIFNTFQAHHLLTLRTGLRVFPGIELRTVHICPRLRQKLVSKTKA